MAVRIRVKVPAWAVLVPVLLDHYSPEALTIKARGGAVNRCKPTLPFGPQARRNGRSQKAKESRQPPAQQESAFTYDGQATTLLAVTAVTLPPELERFVAEAVARGRYRDLRDVVQAGLTLLKDAETQVAEFVKSLEEAEAEGERDGFLTAEEVHREMSAMLDEMTRTTV